jgi:hypothetical protein
MAAENLASINSALSTFFAPDLHRQWNRTSVLLGLLAAKGDIGDGKGKSVNFDLEFTGNTAQTVAEGSDVQASEFASDINVPAILPWAHYRSSFAISETEFDAAMTSQGVPAALQDLFGDRILGAGAQIARKIEQDAMTGTGVDANGNPTLVGLFGGALITSGAYAGVNTATYPEWASYIAANSGTLRALTFDLMSQVDMNIFNNSQLQWDALMTSAGIIRKYESIFTTNAQGGPVFRMNDNAQAPQYGAGFKADGQMQPISAWYKGMPVFRNSANPANKAVFLNTSKIMVKYLPRNLQPQDAVFAQMMGIQGSSGGIAPIQATQIPARIAILAKTGDATKVSLKVTLQMCVVRPNALGILQDINEV